MKSVVVVGSGLAGLSAGYRLHQLGWQVTVFESLDRVGGRAWSESENGFLFDVGPTIVTDNYSEYMKLVADVGLSNELVDCPPEIAVAKGSGLHIIDTRKPLRSFLSTKLLPPAAKLRLVVRGVRLIKPLYGMNPYDLSNRVQYDTESIATYVDRVFGPELNELLIEGVTRSLVTSTPGEVSAVGFLAGVVTASGKMQTVKGGLQRLPLKVAAQLDVRLNSPVTAVRRTDRGVEVRRGAEGQERADACVIATPFRAAADMYPPLLQGPGADLLQMGRDSSGYSVQLTYSRRTDKEPFFVMVPMAASREIGSLFLEHVKAPDRAPADTSLITAFFTPTPGYRRFDLGLAVVELSGGSFAANARQRGQIEDPAQSAVVAFGSVQIAGDAAGIPWHRNQSSVGGQASGGGKRCQGAPRSDEEFGAQAGPEARQRLDDPRVGVIPEPFGDGLVDLFNLAVELKQLTGQPLDQRGGAGLPGQRQVLLVGQRDRGGRGLGDPGRPGLVFDEMGSDTVDSGRADLTRRAQTADQDQRCAVRVVKRGLQRREDRSQQGAQPVNAPDPVGHQIGAVAGQLGQLHHQLVGNGDLSQIASQPSGFSDYPGIFSVRLALPAKRAGHGVDHPPGHINHRLPGTQQHGDQHQRHRTGQIDRPPHLIDTPVRSIDQLLDHPLLVGDLLSPHHLSSLIHRTRMMAGFADVDADPHLWLHRHLCSPVIAAQARGQPRRQIPKQRRFASALNQQPERPERWGSQSFRATTTTSSHQLHPTALGIQGTNPRQLRT